MRLLLNSLPQNKNLGYTKVRQHKLPDFFLQIFCIIPGFTGRRIDRLLLSGGHSLVFAADGLAAAGSGEVWFGPVPGEGLKLFTLQVPDGWSIHPAETGITADSSEQP